MKNKNILAKINSLSLPVTILIASFVIGGFYYATQANKQKAIEKQQEVKAEQDKKEYIAKRKNECYGIYEKEREEWTNVKGMNYSELRDICFVIYESKEPAKSEEECKKYLENISDYDEELQERLSHSYFDCLSNLFRKEF